MLLPAIMVLLMVTIMAVLMVILMVVLMRAIMTVFMTTMIPPKKHLELTFALPRCSESKRGDEKTADVLHPLPDPRARKGVPL